MPTIFDNNTDDENNSEYSLIKRVLHKYGEQSYFAKMQHGMSKIDQSNKSLRLKYIQSVLNDNFSNKYLLSLTEN